MATCLQLYIFLFMYCCSRILMPGNPIQTRGTKPTEEMLKFYVASIALILEDIHRKGAIHCSVLPENVVLDENGYVRLVDWATSTTWQPGVNARVFQGTTEFCAPEVSALPAVATHAFLT